MTVIDLDALETLVRSGNAYGDGQTTLTLIANLRIARADRSNARRQRDEERTAKEGNVRALDAALTDLRRAQECIDDLRNWAREETRYGDAYCGEWERVLFAAASEVKDRIARYDEGKADGV